MPRIFHTPSMFVLDAEDDMLIRVNRTAAHSLALMLAAAEKDRGAFPETPGWAEIGALRDVLDVMLIGAGGGGGIRTGQIRAAIHSADGTAVASSANELFWNCRRCCEEKTCE